MSDVSSFTLFNPVMFNPIHKTKQECIEILQIGGSLKSLAGRKDDIESIIESDLFQDQYDFVLKTEGEDKLKSFKKELARMINCNVVATSMAIPGQVKSKPFMCKSPACHRCAPYKARMERVKYPANTVAITMSDNLEETKNLVDEINRVNNKLDIDWLFAVYTPFHDGRIMIRLINLRIHDMNPLLDDNEIKRTYAEFIECYPMFEQVEIISNYQDTEVVYLTDSGHQFTSTQLWTSRHDGRSGAREGGKNKGYEFDHELGVVIYMTDKERKKKQQEENGVIGQENVPAINADDVPYEILLPAVEDAVEANCEPGELAVMSPVELDPIKHKAVNIMNDIRNGLAIRGYNQSDFFINVQITQADLDMYLENIGTGASRLPENLMSIEFTPEMLEMGEHVHGLRERRRIILNNSYAHAQTVMKRAMTKKEFAEKIAKAIKKID